MPTPTSLRRGAKVLTSATVTTTPSQVLAANGNRIQAALTNPQPPGGTVIYLGPSNVSTGTYTLALQPGATYLDEESSDAWSAVVASGSVTLAVTETS